MVRWPHGRYTTAWICALHIETAAARTMLDETHDGLPAYSDDTNAYTLGRIKDHHIVIACLAAAQYGSNSAASVITNLRRTFPSIRQGLILGIGGGVPTKADVRLGDIVVGSRVMQYDLGNIVGEGKVERTAVARLPQQSLGTLVSSLRSKHELEPSRISAILQDKLKAHIEYSRSTSRDRLFRATYRHPSPDYDCDECDQSKLITSVRRSSDTPILHYNL